VPADAGPIFLQSVEGPVATTALAPAGGAVPLSPPASVDITAPGAGPVESEEAPIGGDVLAVPGPPRTGRRAHRRRAHRRLKWSLALAMVAILGATAGWVGAQRINHPLTHPAVLSDLPSSLPVQGAAPALPWPAKGQAALSVPSLGYTQQSAPELPVPIASLTKMTNAVVVLRDHPMAPGASGPNITITADDVAEYNTELHNDQSTVAIRFGEVLTERQMLEALLTQSANNIAYALAAWDAGSQALFVAKMNALAVSLGATSSHYVDASGYDPHSVSTAADCLRVAAAGMSDPTFAQVVSLKSVTLPLVGTLPNIVSEIGANNVVGIKSGYTTAAGGCMVLAANRVVQGRSVTVLVAVLAQPVPPPTLPKPTPTTAPPTTTTTTTTTTTPPAPGAAPPPTTAPPPPTTTTPPPPTTTTTTIPLNDLPVVDPLRYTRPVAEGLLTATEAAVVPVAVASPGRMVGTVTATWGGQRHRVGVVTSKLAFVLGWPGQHVVSATKLEPVPAGGAGGRRVGTALYALGSQIQAVPLALATTVPEPSWWWRLIHN
jgi:hypothetical protein